MGCGCGRSFKEPAGTLVPLLGVHASHPGIDEAHAGGFPTLWLRILDYLSIAELAKASCTCR